MEELTVSERVRTVYQEVWHEFFDWEHEYCLQTLAALASTLDPDATSSNAGEESLEDRIVSSDEATYIDRKCMEITYYRKDSEDGKTDSETLSCPTFSCGSLDPAQPYEACTYTHKNLYIADDHCEKLAFIPFADDPRFPIKELLECYDSNGWEGPKKDPDYDVIAAEAARRLHFRFGIPFAEIDDTEILPTVIVERPEKKGLIHILNQRDILSWPGANNSDLPPLPQTDAPLPTTLRKRVGGIRDDLSESLTVNFEVNLDEQFKKPMSITVDGDEKGERDPPCGYDCYKYNSEELEGLTDWDAATLDDFKFILEGAADLSSCDLAIVCDRPCREIYAHRRIYAFNRSDNEEPSSEKDPHGSDSDTDSTSDQKPIFNDVVRGSKASDALPPSEICQHLGECNSQENCRCYRKNLHCHRNCRCDLSCRRRPRGCWCKVYGRKRCGTSKCPCYRAGRECDPELCQKCGAKAWSDVKQNGGCRNNGLQHGISKALEVKDGAYGLGLFLLETAREGDLVGEYVGEILSDKMADARGVLTRHLGRNYLFGLNETWTIDAALAGNEMRFINHATGNQANCRAEVREVNGDHRIGIYAVKKDIQPGQELFMDYGKEYFTSGPVGGTPRADIKR